MKYELYSLFPKLVYSNILEDVTDKQLLEIKNYLDNIKYKEINNSINLNNNYTSSSQNNFVFKDKELFFIKERIMKEFIFFKNFILKYKNNDFIFTTSWVAKSEKNEISEYHNHNNCMYSGIFYVNTDENCGQLCFENFGDKRFNLIPTEYNIYNCLNFNFKPKNKMIIFFPSELFHKILKNNSDIIRYSIAFNMIPVGNIGNINSDSFLKIDTKND
jgi:uncharacterized protein (TIGR02466 family)